MVNREKAKMRVKELIGKYDKIVVEKRFVRYNEEMTKKDFILPLFRALGWNIEDSYEVTAEERVSKGWVDYGFRIDGIPKFFLEAKPLKADLSNPTFAEQAINYAWHKGCTWAVLTDFEELKVFNAEWKTTELHQSLFFSIDCHQFLERFDQLWLLSKESFKQGLIDKEAEKWGKKSKKMPVGEQLLSDLTKWRSQLSNDIVVRNREKNLTEVEIDEAVQRIIDRLIFIRSCEDRELEPPTLLRVVREWDSERREPLVKHIAEVFRHFDEEYNSKLFQHHLCDDLDVSNQVLQGIVEDLYHTRDKTIKYDFSALDADVLGNVYEQYLCHILKKTEKRAKVEEKHAYRKEQGIYYTPTYIVDYIVRNTVGNLLKEGVDVEKIRVLDPACGSGSFLIKAFDVLYEFLIKSEHPNQTKFNIDSSGWSPFKLKERILLNNIFGVDLDSRAVEIAQLNLLLKIAEKKQRLPMLQKNIKCGNSLIDDEKVAGDKAFKWEKEFKQIIEEGGFDVVIGNPPYVRHEELLDIKPYLKSNYQVYHGMADLFVYFFEKGFELLKKGGYFGMIVSNKWLKACYAQNLRQFLSKYWIERFIDFGDLPIFQDATTYPCIIIMRKIREMNPKILVCQVSELSFTSIESFIQQNHFFVNQRDLDNNGWNFQRQEEERVLKKIRDACVLLKEYTKNKVYRGVLTGFNKAFVISEKTKSKLIREDPKAAEIIKPFLTGGEVKKYSIDSKGKYLIFTRRGVDIHSYPSVRKYLEQFKSRLTPKTSRTQTVGRKPGDYKWYEIQDTIAYFKEFEKPKIIYGKITTQPRFALDLDGYIVNDSIFFFPFVDKKLLAILNSKLGWFLIKNTCTQVRGGYQLIWRYFGNLPIAKEEFPELEKLVDRMLSLHKRLNEIGDKETDEKKRIKEEIKRIDAEIDELVYKLYGVTEEEKKIIEKSLKIKELVES